MLVPRAPEAGKIPICVIVGINTRLGGGDDDIEKRNWKAIFYVGIALMFRGVGFLVI